VKEYFIVFFQPNLILIFNIHFILKVAQFLFLNLNFYLVNLELKIAIIVVILACFGHFKVILFSLVFFSFNISRKIKIFLELFHLIISIILLILLINSNVSFNSNYSIANPICDFYFLEFKNYY
jgi:hypothetical protein